MRKSQVEALDKVSVALLLGDWEAQLPRKETLNV